MSPTNILMQALLIPFDGIGTVLFIGSIIVCFGSLWVITELLRGKIPVRRQIKYLSLFNNLMGILWGTVSCLRYYFLSDDIYPIVQFIHVLIGLCVVVGDFMSQFETLKLFNFISGLDSKKITIGQLIGLGVCLLATIGSFLSAFRINTDLVDKWKLFGPVAMLTMILGFYSWYHMFLVTKIYKSMKANLAKKKLLEEKKTQDYVKLMLEFVVHGSILMFGLLLWGFGVGYESPSFSIVLKRMLIRGGELICQVHCVVSVLFFKQLRDFRFKTEQGKLPVTKEVPAARPVEKTLQIEPEKTLKMVQM